jgi:hypothetical protein
MYKDTDCKTIFVKDFLTSYDNNAETAKYKLRNVAELVGEDGFLAEVKTYHSGWQPIKFSVWQNLLVISVPANISVSFEKPDFVTDWYIEKVVRSETPCEVKFYVEDNGVYALASERINEGTDFDESINSMIVDICNCINNLHISLSCRVFDHEMKRVGFEG